MPIYYNNKTIIPCPIASISQRKNRVGDNRQISVEYNINLSGTILPFYSGVFNDSSENIKGAFVEDEALAQILQKQNELREIFSEDGKLLEIQGWDGSPPEKFIPIIESIDFSEGQWVNTCEYTINMVATRLISRDGESPDYAIFDDFGDYRISQANDEYAMQNNGDGSAEVTRTITANGALSYSDDGTGSLYNGILPWQQASGWCESVYTENIESWYGTILDSCLPNYEVIDTKVSKNVSSLDGSYTIERGWLISNTGVYITGKASTESEEKEQNETALSLAFDVQGLGFTSPVRSDNAATYWSDKSITTKDEKIEQIKSEFSDIGADGGGYYFSSYSEVINREAGSINNALELVGTSGVFHSYNISANTEWINLPNRSIDINGSINGTGDNVEEKLESALDYYQTIDFNSIVTNVKDIEFGEGDIYLQTQSLSTNNESGEVNYTRTYTNYPLPYKDTWTIERTQSETGDGDTITLSGEIIGLDPDKSTRWTDVYSYFQDTFTTDQAIWTLKVASVLGNSVPTFAFGNTRTFSYNDVEGTISYSYSFDTVDDSSGQIDYSIDTSYNVATDTWTITTNGTVRGAGNTSSEKVESAFNILPHENEVWQYTYNVVVSKLDDNSTADDQHRITEIQNSRLLISRNFSTNDNEGIITFTYVWNTGEENTGYSVKSTSNYSWDEATAIETVTVNGTITAYPNVGQTIKEALDAGWEFVYNSGNPDCPSSIYAARHQTYFGNKDNISEQFSSTYPISAISSPSSVLSFNRSATLNNSSYSLDEQNGVINYTFEFAYRAWRYNLPLWLTNVSISFNKVKSVDKFVRQEIIGKRTGPVHQLINSRNATAFSFSVTLGTSKRKADQFGGFLYEMLEEYTEYVMRKTFLENSGYSDFNYSIEQSSQNCYLEGDSFDIDVINGSVTRSATIYMLDILD